MELLSVLLRVIQFECQTMVKASELNQSVIMAKNVLRGSFSYEMRTRTDVQEPEQMAFRETAERTGVLSKLAASRTKYQNMQSKTDSRDEMTFLSAKPALTNKALQNLWRKMSTRHVRNG